MSLLDKLRQAWQDSKTETGTATPGTATPGTATPGTATHRTVETIAAEAVADAKAAAARAAIEQAAAAARKAVEAVGNEFLDDAEKMLGEAEQARAGRPELRPGDPDKAQSIEAYVKDLAGEAEQVRKTRAEREAAAREELARLKAERSKPPE